MIPSRFSSLRRDYHSFRQPTYPILVVQDITGNKSPEGRPASALRRRAGEQRMTIRTRHLAATLFALVMVFSSDVFRRSNYA